jgi:hypothetical protein
MRSFSEYKGIEVSGRTIQGLILAFGQFRAVASKYLLEEGVGEKGPDGLVTADPVSWYPMDAQMRALARFRGEMGDSVVHQIGVSTAKAVEWPPGVKDMKGLIQQLDRGYHLHHRKLGKVMWDSGTGQMLDGIGHYAHRVRADGVLELESDIPYPCPFDKGLLFGAMRVLHAHGAILHDDSLPCRDRGAKSCIYVVKG